MGKRPRQDEEEDLEDDEAGDEEMMQEMVASGAFKMPQGNGAAAINNKAGLLQALESIRQDLPWVERLEVVSAEPANIKNVNDDLQVELAFYGQSLAAVIAARSELDRLGVPHRRPTDYLAQMLKSDDHMKKVKEKLLLEKKKITAVEHRRKEKDSAAFNKQATAEKARSKALEKRASIAAVDSWRKGKLGSRPDLESDADLEKLFDRNAGAVPGAAGAHSSNRDKSVARFKREGKDKKYGHGGKKGEVKRNDRGTAGNMKDFSVKRMKGSLPPGLKLKSGKGKKNAGSNRPGKRARMSSHK